MRRTLALLVLPLVLSGCPKSEDPCTPQNQKAATWDLMRSWYLYPGLLRTIDPGDPTYPTVQDYLNALTADARAAGQDRGWTYATTLTQATQYYDEGTSVGFGIGILQRTAADTTVHLFVSQVFPGSAAADASFLRGDEILAIGDTPGALVDVGTLIASGTLGTALGPAAAGITRSFSVVPAGAAGPTAAVPRTMTKRTYGLDPVPQGWAVIPNGTGKTGYVALRTFITPAEAQLQNVFAAFQVAGVTDVVVDLRYNGGGRISTAYLLANLLGGDRLSSDVMFGLEYNAAHAAENQSVPFVPAPQSVKPVRIAFITTGASASASELVPNVLEAWRHADVALVGARTYGKPVGQQPFQLQGCDLVVNVVALRVVNAEGDGAYYQGLPDQPTNGTAPLFSGPLCAAADDLTHVPSDPTEASTAAALSWLATGTCPPPPLAPAKPGPTALKATGLPAQDAYPESPAPDEAQRNVRGLF